MSRGIQFAKHGVWDPTRHLDSDLADYPFWGSSLWDRSDLLVAIETRKGRGY